MNRTAPSVLGGLAFVLGSLAILAVQGCSDPAKNLPIYGTVPRFALIDSNGQPFDSASLHGKVVIADFIYTHCPGPCPRMTSQMHTVEQKISGRDDVQILSFTVDPAQDTPEVLNAYAKKFGGTTRNWRFLTGSPDTLHELARNIFKVGDLVGVMDHSTRFMVVDKKGRIRGYYSTFDADGLPMLLRDVKALERTKS